MNKKARRALPAEGGTQTHTAPLLISIRSNTASGAAA